MGDRAGITKMLRIVSVIPKLWVCVIPNRHSSSRSLLQFLQHN